MDSLQSNYSKVGTELIENLYGNEFLSLSGEQSSDDMIALTGLSHQSFVLDIGSGVGGPAFYLTKKTQCRIVGIDLIEWNVEEANKRSNVLELKGKTSFLVADATNLPFVGESFDCIWSQDAFCHLLDKTLVLSEAARLLKSGGYMAFTDWVRLAEMEVEYLQKVQSAAASPNFATPESYLSWLNVHGFGITSRKDISHHFEERYRSMILKLKQMKTSISNEFSPRVFEIMVEKNSMILQGFEDRKIGGIQLVAKKF